MEKEVLNDELGVSLPEYKIPKKTKILLIILSILVVVLLIVGIIFIIRLSKMYDIKKDLETKIKEKEEEAKEKEEKEKEKEEERKKKEEEAKKTQEMMWNIYGEIIYNITYDQNDYIANSFKEEGENYNPIFGNVNNGRDYKKNERNKYTLYLPYAATKKKDQNNGIILFIHGGAWIKGDKESMDYFCRMYAQQGYITATMGYTLLNMTDTDYSVFRMVDEITATIDHMKKKLKDLGFDDEKLEMAIGGHSAGAHLTVLYGYLKKNSSIPIRFLINLAGPVSLVLEHFLEPKKEGEIFDSIDKKTIDQAIADNKLQILEKYISQYLFLHLMNFLIGNRYTVAELNSMMKGKEIDTENEKYKELLSILKPTFPTELVNEKSIPTICVYGGLDIVIGIAQYAQLEDAFIKANNKNIEFIYSKYSGHSLIDGLYSEDGKNALRMMNDRILNYTKTYFKQ